MDTFLYIESPFQSFKTQFILKLKNKISESCTYNTASIIPDGPVLFSPFSFTSSIMASQGLTEVFQPHFSVDRFSFVSSKEKKKKAIDPINSIIVFVVWIFSLIFRCFHFEKKITTLSLKKVTFKP